MTRTWKAWKKEFLNLYNIHNLDQQARPNDFNWQPMKDFFKQGLSPIEGLHEWLKL